MVRSVGLYTEAGLASAGERAGNLLTCGVWPTTMTARSP